MKKEEIEILLKNKNFRNNQNYIKNKKSLFYYGIKDDLNFTYFIIIPFLFLPLFLLKIYNSVIFLFLWSIFFILPLFYFFIFSIWLVNSYFYGRKYLIFYFRPQVILGKLFIIKSNNRKEFEINFQKDNFIVFNKKTWKTKSQS